MPVEVFLGLFLLMALAGFLCVVLIFRLAIQDWTFWDDD